MSGQYFVGIFDSFVKQYFIEYIKLSRKMLAKMVIIFLAIQLCNTESLNEIRGLCQETSKCADYDVIPAF